MWLPWRRMLTWSPVVIGISRYYVAWFGGGCIVTTAAKDVIWRHAVYIVVAGNRWSVCKIIIIIMITIIIIMKYIALYNNLYTLSRASMNFVCRSPIESNSALVQLIIFQQARRGEHGRMVTTPLICDVVWRLFIQSYDTYSYFYSKENSFDDMLFIRL